MVIGKEEEEEEEDSLHIHALTRYTHMGPPIHYRFEMLPPSLIWHEWLKSEKSGKKKNGETNCRGFFKGPKIYPLFSGNLSIFCCLMTWLLIPHIPIFLTNQSKGRKSPSASASRIKFPTLGLILLHEKNRWELGKCNENIHGVRVGNGLLVYFFENLNPRDEDDFIRGSERCWLSCFIFFWEIAARDQKSENKHKPVPVFGWGEEKVSLWAST